MSDTKEKKNRKLFYSIGEVAQMFDVNVSLIRHWCNYFDTLKPRTNNKGNRVFTPKDIETVKTIYHLVKEKGIHLEKAKEFLKSHPEKLERDIALLERLLNIKSHLEEVLINLENKDDETIIYKLDDEN